MRCDDWGSSHSRRDDIPVWIPADNIAVLQLNIATSTIAVANLDDVIANSVFFPIEWSTQE